MACIRLPLREILDEHAIFAGEIAVAEMNGDCLRIGRRGQAGHDDAEVFCVRKIDFADAVRGFGTHYVRISQKFLIGLHAFLTLFTRHALWKASDDGEMQVLAFGASENHTVRVNQSEFVAVAQKCDWSALR